MIFFFTMIFVVEYTVEYLFWFKIFYQYFQCVACSIVYYRLHKWHSINLVVVGERREKFVQEIEIKVDIVSDNNWISSEKFLYFLCYCLSSWSSLQFVYRESCDKSYDMFEFVSFFVWLDKWLIFTDDFSSMIKLYNPYLNRFILCDIESCCFKV